MLTRRMFLQTPVVGRDSSPSRIRRVGVIANKNGQVATLPETPIVGTLAVYHSRMRCEEGTDYSVSGDQITFLYWYPDDTVLCDYEVEL